MAVNTVMLIDDEQINNTLHKRILLRIKPQLCILEYTDPTEALTYIIQHQDPVPDIIFLDIYMPEMYAWDFLDALPDNFPIPKIYICTKSEDYRDMEKAAQYPTLKGFTYKFFDAEVIERIIKNS